MAAPAERLHFRLTGEALEGGITPDEGREILRRVLAARTERIVVAPRPIKGLVAAMRRYQRDLVATSSDAGARDAEERRPEEYEAPATDLERRIAAEWQGVLGVTGIGRNDEYGRLGGDSLIAVRLVARLKEALGVPLSIRTLYDAPTVARLAREVEALRGGTDAAGRETETGEI
jgi:acyl carrier protein